MYSISNEIGKNVISLYEMKKVGIINNILFSNKTRKAKYLIIVDEEDDYKRYVVDIKQVYSFGNDIITLKNSTCLHSYENLELEISGYYNPIFDTIITLNGKNIGFIKDVSLTNTYSINYMTTDSGQKIQIKDILCFNHHALILKEKGVTTLAQFKPTKTIQIPEECTNQLVTTLQVGSAKPAEQNTILPNKAITNYHFLIGRIVKRNILAYNGDLLIKENTQINSSIIDKARTFGKLKELMEASHLA